jgi:hypothetical protein
LRATPAIDISDKRAMTIRSKSAVKPPLPVAQGNRHLQHTVLVTVDAWHLSGQIKRVLEYIQMTPAPLAMIVNTRRLTARRAPTRAFVSGHSLNAALGQVQIGMHYAPRCLQSEHRR